MKVRLRTERNGSRYASESDALFDELDSPETNAHFSMMKMVGLANKKRLTCDQI